MGWEAWSEETFGTPFEIWHDGLAIDRFDRLSAGERARALEVLPEGIALRSHVAAVGVRKLAAVDLLPLLHEQIPEARGQFLVEATRALDELGDDPDAGRTRILQLLGSEPLWSMRVDLAIGLRYLDSPATREGLLTSIARDPDYLVRYHAAESLLRIGGLEPLAISEHGDLFGLIVSDEADDHRRAAELLGERLADRSAGPPQ